jgi:hypothetical protein
MKSGWIAAALAGLLLAGCSSVQTASPVPGQAYRTEVAISPAEEAHQYVVEFKISHVSEKGPVILSMPRLKVKAGEEGTVKVGDSMDRDTLYCTALITENTGSIQAATRVIVKSQGKETSHTTHTITVKK